MGQTLPQPASTVPAARQATHIAVITVKGDIDVNPPGTSIMANSFARRLRLAERAGADAIVVELDTPGGSVSSVLAMTSALKGSPITNTVAWVNPQAFSGGAIIAWACREIVASPNASTGDALPILRDPQTGFKVANASQLKKILPPLMADLTESARRYGRDEYMVQALVNDSVELWYVEEIGTGRRFCVDEREYRLIFGEAPARGLPRLTSASPIAPASNRPAAPAESKTEGEDTPRTEPASAAPAPGAQPMESEQKYQPASPKLERIAGDVNARLEMGGAKYTERPVFSAADRGKWKLVSYVSNGSGPIVLKHDDLQFFGMLSGTISNDEELKAFFGAKHLIRLDQNWSEGLVWFLTQWPVRYLLIAVFLVALFAEMTHPGVTLPGVIAAAALVALIAPPLLIDLANWWEIGAILVGIVLILLELFVIPGFGVTGVAGILLLFGGMVGTFVPAGGFFADSAAARQDLLYGVVTMVMSIATAGAGMYFLARNFKSLPVFNRLVLQDPDFDEGSDEDMLAAMGGAVGGSLKKGMTGLTITPLRPSGKAEFAGPGPEVRLVDVVAEIGYIPAGARVRIISVSDFRIAVELADDGAGPGAGDRRA